MKKFTIRFSNEGGGQIYTAIVEAETEKQAFLMAVKEAENKGKTIPEEVWTSCKQHK